MAAPSKSYVVVTDSQIAPNAPGDTILMTGFRDSLVNHEEWLGKNYAAAIDHDHDDVNSKAVVGVASSSIGQAELKTSSGIVSATAGGNITLPGGGYGFYPQTRISDAGATWRTRVTQTMNWTSFRTNIGAEELTGTATFYAQQRYITACEPFNLGDGDIPLFVFALVDSNGKVIATYSADTPPWFYNGRSENTFDPKKYKKKKGKKNYFYDRPLPLPDKKTDFAAYLEAVNTPLKDRVEEIEITTDMKNLDMDIIPHPFIGNDLTGKSVVLLAPVGSMAEKMRELHDQGESVADLLHGGYLLIGGELDANSPIGVKTHKVRWK